MYAKLGNIEFSNLLGFTDLSIERSARFSEMELIDGKSRLQNTGNNLQVYSAGVFLHKQFIDVDSVIEELEGYVDGGEVLDFVTGSGEIYGKFVIETLSKSITKTNVDGSIISARINFTLKEYVDPDPEQTAANSAKSTAFALSNNALIRISSLDVEPLPAVFVSNSVIETRNRSLEADGFVTKAIMFNSERDSYLSKAQSSVSKVIESARGALDKINEIESLAAKAPQLAGNLEATIAGGETLKTAIESGDLAGSRSASSALLGYTTNLSNSIFPIDVDIITRKG